MISDMTNVMAAAPESTYFAALTAAVLAFSALAAMLTLSYLVIRAAYRLMAVVTRFAGFVTTLSVVLIIAIGYANR